MPSLNKSTTLACFASTVLFAVLATPIRLAAQVQERCNQTNYFVKNLDTLEGTSTQPVSCAVSDLIADKRPVVCISQQVSLALGAIADFSHDARLP
jgi:hypothetical protein